ncbi:MAG: NTP transferase domain-containing protein [Meiothermus sp.]|uniref:nucleotidyltransferase family protein n=1 Tax=Meiothermus sp. TaxID=1955249 RepID=UPI0025E4ABEB|nr:NTP transferase domain-containing protein [Meiothermus sp.]MCS7195527.1 NTP transferase domain-containing protein [Meiothermus sp.]
MALDALVLSAGRASRFGVPKFLLPAGPGQVLLTRALDQALGVADGRVVVVVGHAAELARYALGVWLADHPAAGRVQVVENPAYAAGQSSSLKCGVGALGASEGALVFLADMPALEEGRLLELKRAVEDRPPSCLAVAPCEDGEPRPPVFVGAGLFPEVARLEGDQGARALLRVRRERVVFLEWGRGPWFADVDTWEQYVRVAQALGWAREPAEPFATQRVGLAEAAGRIEAALRAGAAPLAPGVLLVPGKTVRWLELEEPYRGVHSLLEGPAPTPEAYLGLLRRAVLWLLRREAGC